jgi:hypothetical protein
MRPITVTVLSDYGRDRTFYQAYEHLFDPPSSRNGYRSPTRMSSRYRRSSRSWIGSRCELIQGDAAAVADLRAHLVAALAVDEPTAEALLWEPPRSLLLEAVPTLVRRLFRRWELAFPGTSGSHAAI